MADKQNKKKAAEEEELEETEEIVSGKKVIYIEIDDEITTVCDKIHSTKPTSVYIVAPQKSAIFQSIVNLKILKRKAEQWKKEISFVTNDKNGVYLAQRLGISVYDKVSAKGKPSLFSTKPESDEIQISPLSASINSIEEEAPTRLKEKKISICEILKKSTGKNAVRIQKIEPERKKERQPNRKLVLLAPNKHALMGLVSVSLTILLVIVYIALPGATVYLTPAASVLEKSVNITLADFNRNKGELDTHPKHVIASYPIDKTITKTITHYTTGKKFSERGANASGIITIINSSNIEWPLVVSTRFQTNEGVVFRLVEGVTVPRANANGFGTSEVFVIADPTDAYGAIVGARGNIEPTSFFLPGLRDDSRSKLYAESSKNMTGGVTDFVEYVSVEDITAARAKIHDELMNSISEELRLEVEGKTDLVDGDTQYTLLEGDGAINIGEVTVHSLDAVDGQNIKQFDVTGEVYVSGIYYDHEAMLAILVSELTLKKSPQKELLKINEESSTYRIFERDTDHAKIKLTANIKGIEQYTIDPEKENGERLLSKIQAHIAGKQVEEAKEYIQNLPEINKVEIESWPMWAPTLPKISDNIEFDIRDAIVID